MGQAADAVDAGGPGALQPSFTVAWIVVFGLRAIALCGLRKCMLLAAADDEGRALVACWELQTMLQRHWACGAIVQHHWLQLLKLMLHLLVLHLLKLSPAEV
jgi:hypothetical protein